MTNKNFIRLALVLFMAASLNPGIGLAQSADNTKVNQRDRAKEELTAGQQGQAKEDLRMTQEIRKAILDEKNLSLYAHNVKIITTKGMVTLKGPVASVEEKQVIENIASKWAGVGYVQSEIAVVSK